MRGARAVAGVASCALLLCAGGAGAASGSGWTAQSSPNPSGVSASELVGVSCPSAKACLAIGFSSGSRGRLLLAESWNGSRWTLLRPSVPAGAKSAEFVAVSCSAANACTAVGDYTKTTANQTLSLAERWTGRSWQIQQTPNPGVAPKHPAAGQGAGTELSGVSCPAASACTAVGGATDSAGHNTTLVERWNGRSWSVQSSPSASGRPLGGVSCPSSGECVAVGDGTVSSGTVPLAERWNGSSWSILANPPGTTLGLLVGVACSASAACSAVGDRSTAAGLYTTLAERWNGSKWAAQSAPAPGGSQQATVLAGVSCPAGSSCIAVGAYSGSGGGVVPLIESWNGRAWTVAKSPPPSRDVTTSSLSGVSCPAGGGCIAVGFATVTAKGGARTVTLVERLP